MNHALILNVGILAVVLIALFATSNPLVLLGIAFLKDMPYGLLDNSQPEVEEEEPAGRPIGFVHGDE